MDEDCDGWLGTSHGYNVRASHPRVLLTPEMLDAILVRMTGPSAREPYRAWYDLIKAREDQEQDVDLVNLALIYKATGNPAYLPAFPGPQTHDRCPGDNELFAVDLLWDEIPDADKLNIMARVSGRTTPGTGHPSPSRTPIRPMSAGATTAPTASSGRSRIRRGLRLHPILRSPRP